MAAVLFLLRHRQFRNFQVSGKFISLVKQVAAAVILTFCLIGHKQSVFHIGDISPDEGILHFTVIGHPAQAVFHNRHGFACVHFTFEIGIRGFHRFQTDFFQFISAAAAGKHREHQNSAQHQQNYLFHNEQLLKVLQVYIYNLLLQNRLQQIVQRVAIEAYHFYWV